MIIDVFCHHIGRDAGKILDTKPFYGKGKEFPYPEQNADAETRLGLMKNYGVDVQALTQTTPVLLGMSTAEALEVCRVSNDDNYALCKAYPDKFVNICIASMMDIKADIKEVERNIKEQDARAVTINTTINGKALDAPEFDPFWAAMEKFEMPIFLHPVSWKDYPLAEKHHMMNLFGWPFDTSITAWTLVAGGVLDRFPTLQFVLHHMGAMLPFLGGRMRDRFSRYYEGKLKHPGDYYWRNNFYADTAVDGGPEAYLCGYAFWGADRILFGTDYPFGNQSGEAFIRDNVAGVKAMKIPDADKEKIFSENAKKLLKIK